MSSFLENPSVINILLLMGSTSRREILRYSLGPCPWLQILETYFPSIVKMKTVACVLSVTYSLSFMILIWRMSDNNEWSVASKRIVSKSSISSSMDRLIGFSMLMVSILLLCIFLLSDWQPITRSDKMNIDIMVVFIGMDDLVWNTNIERFGIIVKRILYKTTKGQTFLRFDLVYRRLNLRLSELADVSSQF